MKINVLNRAIASRIALNFGLVSALAAGTMTAHAQAGNVYTTTNNASGNSIIKLHRLQNGTLTAAGSYSTGGLGTGKGLGSQGAILVSPNKQYLYAVDAGSNDVAAFLIQPNGLKWIANVPSGGTEPVSLTAHGNLLYVLNAGGTDNISGFKINVAGSLTAIAHSTQTLSSVGTGAAEVAFSPEGEHLVVTEKATGKIDVFTVDGNGAAGAAVVTTSAGTTPYGFAFDWAGRIIVSEAFGGAAGSAAVSSYFISDFGSLPITASEGDGQTAACWLAVSGNYAWTANAGSGSLSAYYITPNGRLKLVQNAGGLTNLGASSHPTDFAFDAGQRYIYVLENGVGTIAGFQINWDGTLTPITVSSGLGAGLVGLAGL